VRREAAAAAAPAWTRFIQSPYARAAAAVLLIVGVGWLGSRFLGRDGSVPAPHGPIAKPDARALQAELQDRGAKDEEAFAKLEKNAARAQSISIGPDGVWTGGMAPTDLKTRGLLPLSDERTTSALANVRQIASAGPAAATELNRVVTPEASPELRQRQAEFLALLDDNIDEIAQAAGETQAFAQLGKDADDALRVFSSPPPAARPEVAQDKKELGERRPPEADALKVLRDEAPAERKRAGEKGAAPSEPALYMVSGPGAIARVDRILQDRGLESHQVWLKDQDPNPKRQRLDAEETAYRIVEVSVPAADFDALVGDLESLAGLRLAPVGRAEGGYSPPPDRVRTLASRGAQPPGGRAASRPNSLPIRKLRLLLIGA
jgi:hypothetical protein